MRWLCEASYSVIKCSMVPERKRSETFAYEREGGGSMWEAICGVQINDRKRSEGLMFCLSEMTFAYC